MKKKVFARMSSDEFKNEWPNSWMNYASYCRVLIIIRSENDVEKDALDFINDKSYFKLAFVEKTIDNEFDENLLWIYLHCTSEFQFCHSEFISLSTTGDGFNVLAIDVDNRILQKYSFGDIDTGMYYDIDPEDFEPNIEENELYYSDIDDRISESPIEII